MKLLDLREGIDDLFRHPVSKEFVLWVRAHAGKREHGNRINGDCGRGA
jgi:hypothetical protein